MGKYADRFLKGDGWTVVEEGFSPEHSEVSESIFSLANEFTGVRGFFEEGSENLKSLRGVYFNGVYEKAKTEGTSYKGIVQETHFMINSPDWLWTEISADGEKVFVNENSVSDFNRVLNMKEGTLTRSFVWKNSKGKKIKFTFIRFLEMKNPQRAWQKISAQSVDFDGVIEVASGTNVNAVHYGRKKCYWHTKESENQNDKTFVLAGTESTNQKLFIASAWKIFGGSEGKISEIISSEKTVGENLQNGNRGFSVKDFSDDFICGKRVTFNLKAGENLSIEKAVSFAVDKCGTKTDLELKNLSALELSRQIQDGFEKSLESQKEWWSSLWQKSDIQIDGDELDQQGIRFCIFQMNQTYHGISPDDNIGAKGLTGEAYNGHAFWDTETYCLPFYLYSNLAAAKNLLEFRYSTLSNAKARAKMLDCKGACYPVATLNGDEACNLWQHASLQFQPSSGVAYGIAHYYALTGDTEFLYGHGIEMLIEISRFLASRGSWNQDKSGFGFYAVMGPDEFHMMVNNNSYTNFMAKKTFDYTLSVLQEMKKSAPQKYDEAVGKTGFSEDEIKTLSLCSQKMILLYDEKTKLFEQHEGYFSVPHIDVNKIPVEDFPLYSHWSYDRIYRTDMIKQPDVLMFLFLFRNEFSADVIRANYEFYEPRTIHESSLSPSVHSVLACDLKKYDEAVRFFGFATRLDLDNYNRNTCEGLHTTSIAAAWINIVFGFGGLHSEPEMGECLSVAPVLPEKWNSYSFRFIYKNSLVLVSVSKKNVQVQLLDGSPEELSVYGKKCLVTSDPQNFTTEK